MPNYDYRCDACEHEFEEFQSIKDAPLKKCPSCGKNKLRRIISGGAAIVFKGSGFYKTDYRSESYKKSASADNPTPPASTTNQQPQPAANTTATATQNTTTTTANDTARKI
ncbi:MAG: zinc ribbon domain-containing protein [Planctomycetaceae bacterium]|jgi:putative FmdB family regulatory protein|nr:zinc ribbon domain-containing protein [Planctomycetaceae bacterium]